MTELWTSGLYVLTLGAALSEVPDSCINLERPDIAGVSRHTMESLPFTFNGLLMAVRECKCLDSARFIFACDYGGGDRPMGLQHRQEGIGVKGGPG